VVHCGEEDDTKLPRTPVVPDASMSTDGHAGQPGVPQLPAVPAAQDPQTPDPLQDPVGHSLSGSKAATM
jgi:hypothetical protein